MTLKLQKYVHSLARHVLAWCLFVAYDLATVYFYTGTWGNIWTHLLYYAINIGLFYFHTCFVLPFAAFRFRIPYLGYFVLIPAETAGYLLLKGLIDRYVESFPIPLDHWPQLRSYLFINAWRGAYFMGLGTAYWIWRRLLTAERRRRTLVQEKALMEGELAAARQAYLQQQISPHFLFNTLNFMYNAIYKISPGVSEYVLQLSEMMRYSLAEPGTDGKTPLHSELQQIRNFISISRQRYDFQLYLDLEMQDVPADLSFIPLVLLTLTENVFKHGNLKNKERPAVITLSVSADNVLIFTTRNLEKNQTAVKKLKSIGLENTIKRLEYFYKGKYRLQTSRGDGHFELELSVQL